jgi:hypothetical protein
MNSNFILVTWPESQTYIGAPHSYFSDDKNLPDSSYFVREDVYKLGEELDHDDFNEKVKDLI